MTQATAALPFNPVSAADVLKKNVSYIKIQELKEREEPFYIGHFIQQESERGRKQVEDGAETSVVFVFDVYDHEGTFIGTSSTGTLGLMNDIDSLVKKAGPDSVYGPFTVARQGKSFRFMPADA